VVYIQGMTKYVTEDSKQNVAIWRTLTVNRLCSDLYDMVKVITGLYTKDKPWRL